VPRGGAAPAPFGARLAVVFLLGLLVRLVYLWELREADVSYVLVGDAHVYHAWARRIAGGAWLGDAVFYQAPLYPYFLALLYTLAGPSLLVVRFVQAILGAAACAWLALGGRAFFGERVGLIAGTLLAGYAPAVFFDGLIQKSVLDLFLLTALLAVLGRGRRRRPVALPGGWPLAAGLLLGLLVLTRENALVLIPVVAGWLLGAFPAATLRRRLGALAGFGLGAAVVLGPVVARNLGAWLGRPVVADALSRAIMYRNLGVTLLREDRIEPALAYFTRAVETRPTYLDARLALAQALAAAGRQREAIGEYRQILSRAPRHPEAAAELARLLTAPPPGPESSP
jgi:tetratricopeptide (TPR) repeat protein